MKLLQNRVDLLQHMRLPSPVIAAEIGVYRGDFSQCILEHFNDLKVLYLIDQWKELTGDAALDPLHCSQEQQNAYHKEVCDRFLSLAPKVTIVRQDSVQALRLASTLKVALDWVYIDADHTFGGCMADLVAAHSAVSQNGWICGHDYCVNGTTLRCKFGVYDAVNMFCHHYGWELVYVTDETWPSYALQRVRI